MDTTVRVKPPLFDKIIGQQEVKKKISFMLECYKVTNQLENILLSAPQGCGKNLFASEIVRHLTVQNSNRIKTNVTVNCSTIKNLASFFDSIVDRHLRDRDASIILDEASEITKDVQIALLTILDINSEPINHFEYNNVRYAFDNRRLSWVFCTSHAHKIIEPLLDRLETISLESYSVNDISQIIAKHLSYIKTYPELLQIVAKTTKGNARSAKIIAQKIKSYLEVRNKHYFDEDDWEDICNQLTIRPMGINNDEVKILRILNACQNCSLTKLAAILGTNSRTVRLFNEIFLLKNGLIDVSPKGRNITFQGKELLKEIEENS